MPPAKLPDSSDMRRSGRQDKSAVGADVEVRRRPMEDQQHASNNDSGIGRRRADGIGVDGYGAGAGAGSGSGSAGSYPNQLVKIVVPFSAGSVTDGLARIIADKLSDLWKQQVIVENRPGLPGTTSVAKSPPDGYTLMLTSNGHTIAGVINKNIQFDPVKDFSGVTKVASVPMVAV